MTDKALVTSRDLREHADPSVVAEELRNLGVEVENLLAHGVVADEVALQDRRLEERGYRVKRLPDVNLLTVGSYTLDFDTSLPDLPDHLRVPDELQERWRHHLVQLAGPPVPEWVAAVEAQGLEVVEPISGYGLFVYGEASDARSLDNLPFVIWEGPFEPAYRISPDLADRSGEIEYVNVGVYPAEDLPDVLGAVVAAGGTVVNRWGVEGSYREGYAVAIVQLAADQVPAVARQPSVRWLEYHSPQLRRDDERSTQIVAENLDATPPPNRAPVPGYQTSLSGLGLSGSGVVIGICDSGVDTNDPGTMHKDLLGRLAFFVDTTGGTTRTDTQGHGTHVAGIAAGNGATGDKDPQGFLLGQGVAPGASIGSVNPVDTAGSPGLNPVGTFTQIMVTNGAHVMNNSWYQMGGGGYTAGAALVDRLTRDPDPAASGTEYLVMVFSAGNGGPGAHTITPPKEAKNPIVVGNSLTFRPGEGNPNDDIRGIAGNSSRGPATNDVRILPTVVAPGVNIVSARATVDSDPNQAGVQRPGSHYIDTKKVVHQDHFVDSGTSMAAPHVSGLCALLVEWWRGFNGGRNPSPAMVKALLVNGAEDQAGGPDGNGGVVTPIPNNDQGWGRVSLQNIVLQSPGSDRGPRLFFDQQTAFTANGQEFLVRIAPAAAGRPLRVTLVWTDAPGAANASPARVNDLDLEVTELATGTVYRGNVFTGGFSTAGGAFDARDTTECVYVQNPSGTYAIRVIAAALVANARPPFDMTVWQDFALVVENAQAVAPVPVAVVPVVDRSRSMVHLGHEPAAGVASRIFVEQLAVTEGVVSFGASGPTDRPLAAPSPVVTGRGGRDSSAAIDTAAFDGVSLRDGLTGAIDLLDAVIARRAAVLLSDGYDSTASAALDVLAALPGDLTVYTCAMGATADQALLSGIAAVTGGRYLFAPTVNDLFDIYNVIRAHVTGNGMVVNTSAIASSRQVAAVVDSCAAAATFTVTWTDRSVHYTGHDPRNSAEVGVRLRDPRGRLIHPHSSVLGVQHGPGHVAFHLSEPAAGRWFVEVSTVPDSPIRFTVGGFVDSPVRLAVSVPAGLAAGEPLDVGIDLRDGKEPFGRFRTRLRITAPVAGLDTLLDRHADELAAVEPPEALTADGWDPRLARLVALRDRVRRRDGEDLFARRVIMPVAARPVPTGERGSYTVETVTSGVTPTCRSRFVRTDLVSVLVS